MAPRGYGTQDGPPLISPLPCAACPYRRDVPSGVWAASEYDKLIDYDAETGDQPLSAFACHATPENLCHGWAVVHTNRGHEYDLLALRMLSIGEHDIPVTKVPLFSSGTEAAEHGKAEIENPSIETRRAVNKLLRRRASRVEGGSAPSEPA